MTKEMVISTNRHETKVAVLEDDQLVEVYFQRANEYSLAGSIHKGRVTRVLPGMQSAFVDLGLERDTFLYVSDFFEENEEFDQISPEREGRRPREDRRDERPRRDESPRREESSRRDEAPLSTVAPLDVEPPSELPPGIEELPAEVRAGASSEPASAERTGSSDRGPRQDRPDSDRDRQRRSRRRRNRGRGFPESKYAAPSHTTQERPVVEPVEPEEVVESVVSSSDFSILPGESLAKYRHTAVPNLDSGEQEELGAASPAAEHTAEQATPELAPEFLPESEPEPVEATVAAEPFVLPVIRGAETVEEPAEPAIEDLQTEDAEVDELVAEALAEARDELAHEPPPEPAATVEEPHEEEPHKEEPHEIAPPDAPSVESDIEEDLAAAPPLDELGDEPGDEAATPLTEQTGESAEPAEASLRENSGRYIQHRISRRMRRRMRTQGRGGENEPRREGEVVVSAPADAAKPEPRNESRPERRDEGRSETRADARPDVRSESRSESRSGPRPEKGATPSITDLLKEGQEILVQIAKEPLGQKGARITSHIALPGRYVVYMPTLEHMGVSRKIASDEERSRLKRILQAHHQGIQGGYIVRTAGEGKSEEDIASDMSFLANLWIDIRQKAEKRPAPVLLHHDLDIVQRLLRDQLTDNFKAVWVDNEEVYESILRFVQRFQPALVTRVKLYTRPAPIFDAFSITAELEKALRPKVWLKSGGYIVINQTEALVAVDVNTGKFVGKSNRLEDTIVKTNTEAVKEIVRQIRLRDLGGIIVVDFIDMDERKNRQKVMQALEEAMRADKAPYKILQFNDFGLVAITRKRVKQSLERALCTPCPYCEGAGYVKSVQTIVGEILQEAQKIAAAVEGETNVILRVNPEVAKTLKSTQNHHLEELETILRRPVLVKGDPLLHHEKFDLA